MIIYSQLQIGSLRKILQSANSLTLWINTLTYFPFQGVILRHKWLQLSYPLCPFIFPHQNLLSDVKQFLGPLTWNRFSVKYCIFIPVSFLSVQKRQKLGCNRKSANNVAFAFTIRNKYMLGSQFLMQYGVWWSLTDPV